MVTFQFWQFFSFGDVSVLVGLVWSGLVWSGLVTIDDLSISKSQNDVAVSPASRTTEQLPEYSAYPDFLLDCYELVSLEISNSKQFSMCSIMYFTNLGGSVKENHPVIRCTQNHPHLGLPCPDSTKGL